MSGAENLCCPECGHTAGSERRLLATRRRWRWAGVAMALLMAGTYAAVTPKARRDGWLSLLTNGMLIRLLPLSDSPSAPVPSELRGRIQQNALSRRDWERLFDRIVAGDRHARPPTKAWQDKYWGLVPFYMIAQAYFRTDQEAHEAVRKLYQLPPSYKLVTRPVWPEGLPLYVHATYDTWWPLVNAFAMRVQPRLPGATPVMLFGGAAGPTAIEFGELTGPMEDVLTFDVVLYQRHWMGDHSEWTEIGTDVARVPVKIAGRLADIMTPVRAWQIDELLRTQARAHAFRFDAQDHFVVEIDTRCTRRAMCDRFAFGVRGEFLLEGEVVAWTTYWWDAGADGFEFYSFQNPIEGDVDRLRRMAPRERWSLRLRSDPEIAVRVVNRDLYWEGEVTIPLTLTWDYLDPDGQ